MRSPLCRILGLAAFVFWATGLGQYAHQTLVHGHAAVARIPAGSKERPIPTPPPRHSDDDCPVCQGLAAMAVGQTVPPVLPAELEISFEKPVLERESFFVATLACFTPIRGPPMDCACL